MREMAGGAYWPAWSTVELADGRTVQAIIFTANPDSNLHEADDSVDAVAPVIAEAHGPLGSNLDYALQLDEALRARGIEDSYISSLAGRLQAPRPRNT